MKQIVKSSRLLCELERVFRLLNESFFDNQLPMPIMNIIPSSRSYGHMTVCPMWETAVGAKHELNVSSSFLNRPIDEIVETILHECVHLYNLCILGEMDCSRGGTYHNRIFKREAERHGLNCYRTEKYGWSTTKLSNSTLEWLLEHDELREIEMCRINPYQPTASIGTHSNSGIGNTLIASKRNHVRRYECPCCHTVIRATKKINIICGDCMTAYMEG